MEDRLNYKFLCGNESDDVPGVEGSFYTCNTVSQNIDGSSVKLHIPPLPNHFMDTSEFYIKVALQVTKPDGTYLPVMDDPPTGANIDVFPLAGFLNNLWSQCNIRLNGQPLPAGNDYPYIAQLFGILGTSKSVREKVLQTLSGGMLDPGHGSVITPSDASLNISAIDSIAGSRELILYGRIHSDFLVTLAQLLPDNVELDIELIRGRDSFALGSANPNADFRIKLNAVTLFVKRVEFNKAAQNVLRPIVDNGVHLKYLRYQSRVMFVSKDSSTFNWGNVFSGGPLPKRVFFFLVDQSSYSGSIDRRPTYCETAGLNELRFLVDGRDLMPEPYRPDFIDDIVGSDVKGPLLGLNSVIGVFHNQSDSQAATGDLDMLQGVMIYAANLHHSVSNKQKLGSLDVSVSFQTPTPRSYTAICIGEFNQCLKITKDRDVYII